MTDACFDPRTDLVANIPQHSIGLFLIRAEVNRQRLHEKELEGRERAQLGGEGKLANLA